MTIHNVEAYQVTCTYCGSRSPGLWITPRKADRAAEQIGWVVAGQDHFCLDCLSDQRSIESS